MVAWTILYILIGTAVLVGSVGPTTFTPSFHFCIYSAQEIC
jgi:tryptophan-rich sensory protein